VYNSVQPCGLVNCFSACSMCVRVFVCSCGCVCVCEPTWHKTPSVCKMHLLHACWYVLTDPQLTRTMACLGCRQLIRLAEARAYHHRHIRGGHLCLTSRCQPLRNQE
jgi:hypothetical protein